MGETGIGKVYAINFLSKLIGKNIQTKKKTIDATVTLKSLSEWSSNHIQHLEKENT
jgi:hypothetical protein